MTKERAMKAVSEALVMGLTLYHGALNGDALVLGMFGAKYAKRKGIVRYEYFMRHSFGEFSSHDSMQVAEWAIEQAGLDIGIMAEQECSAFVLNIKIHTS